MSEDESRDNLTFDELIYEVDQDLDPDPKFIYQPKHMKRRGQ